MLLFKRYAEERGALAVGAASAENKARVGALFEDLKLLAFHAGGYVARLHVLTGMDATSSAVKQSRNART